MLFGPGKPKLKGTAREAWAGLHQPLQNPFARHKTLWQTIRTPNSPSTPISLPPAGPFHRPLPIRAAPPSFPSTSKRRCAARISTTRCRSSSAVPCPMSATDSSPSIVASSPPWTAKASSTTKSTPSAPASSENVSRSTTPMATRPSMTPSSAWPSRGPSAIPSSMARETSAPSMATRQQHTATPNAAWSASPRR